MKNNSYDVTALGELLIDFTENGRSSQGNPIPAAHHATCWLCCPSWDIKPHF